MKQDKKIKIKNCSDISPSNEEFFCIIALLLVYIFLLLFFSDNKAAIPNFWLILSSIFLFKKYKTRIIKFGTSFKNKPLYIIYFILSLLVVLLSFLFKEWQPVVFDSLFFIDFVLICLMVPFIEELFFRGLLLDIFWRTFRYSFVASAANVAIFSLIHPDYSMMQIFILSSFLCFITVISRNILWPIVFHILWNSLTFIYLISESGYKILLLSITLVVTSIIVIYIKKSNEVKA